MPKISVFFGIIIEMYFEDHNPPHFHARYGDFKAEIMISDLSVKAGYLPSRALGLVVECASQHQIESFETWKLLSEESLFKKIEPLK